MSRGSIGQLYPFTVNYQKIIYIIYYHYCVKVVSLSGQLYHIFNTLHNEAVSTYLKMVTSRSAKEDVNYEKHQ